MKKNKEADVKKQKKRYPSRGMIAVGLAVFLFAVSSFLLMGEGSGSIMKTTMIEDEGVNNNTMVEGAEIVADINIQNVKIKNQNDHEITLSFDFVNNGDMVEAGVLYAVQLSKETKVSEISSSYIVVDEELQKEVISINPGETVHKEVSYSVPVVFSGEHR